MSGSVMKKPVIRLLVLAAAVVSLFVLVSDMQSLAQMTGSLENKARISAIMPHRDDGYWTYVVNGAETGGERYADRVDVKVYYPQLNYNIDQMTALIRRQIAAKVNAIIAQGNEDRAYQQALIDAWNKGIRIVLVDTDIADFVPHIYIGTDNYKAGKEMGRHLAELTGGRANVAVLSGQPGYDNLEERYRGLAEISETYPDIRFITLVYDNYDSPTALSRINQISAQYPQVDTLVCIEGTGGQAIGNNYTKDARKFSYILAFDNMDETIRGLKNGTIDGVEAQEPYQMGLMAVRDIAENAATDTQANRSVFTSIRWLTAENVDEQEQAYEDET